MATSTSKLGLVKPDGTDDVDIAVLNANADKIDAASGLTVCTSGTRPSVPFTGQLIYETDTDKILVFAEGNWQENRVGTSALVDDAVTSAKIATGAVIADGLASNAVTTAKIANEAVTSAKLGPGTILQVVSTTLTTAVTFTSTSFTNIAGLTASITPRDSTSKILVLANINGATENGISGALGYWRLARNGTAIAVGTSTSSRLAVTGNLTTRSTGSSLINFNSSVSHLDSPATTAERTYTIQGLVTLGNMYINQQEDTTNSALYGRSVSTITLLEVAA